MLNYFKQTVSEAKKLSAPSKKEVYITTAMITAAVAVFAIFIMFSDFIISKIIGLIFGL